MSPFGFHTLRLFSSLQFSSIMLLIMAFTPNFLFQIFVFSIRASFCLVIFIHSLAFCKKSIIPLNYSFDFLYCLVIFVSPLIFIFHGDTFSSFQSSMQHIILKQYFFISVCILFMFVSLSR